MNAASESLVDCKQHLDTTSSNDYLEIYELSLLFGATKVLDNVTLRVHEGETVAILGESGCGKTSLLRIVAGLLVSTSGSVRLSGRSIDSLEASKRGIVYLDQDALMFEHLTVYENIAFALRIAKRPSTEIDSKVQQMLRAVQLEDQATKRTWQLSGGQKQRVAFARAILASPRVLLLDEPFCSLDSRNRAIMQQLFLDLRQRYLITCLFVTHDVKEAIVVGNRFATMSGGILKQYPTSLAFVEDETTGAAAERAFWAEQGQIL